MLDLLITGGTVFDGTGGAALRADIGVLRRGRDTFDSPGRAYDLTTTAEPS